MSDGQEKKPYVRKYRLHRINGVGEFRVPAPDPENPSAAVSEIMRKAATGRGEVRRLRFGDKVVYACLAAAIVIKFVLWLTGMY